MWPALLPRSVIVFFMWILWVFAVLGVIVQMPAESFAG
jgi:hypothetical protein